MGSFLPGAGAISWAASHRRPQADDRTTAEDSETVFWQVIVEVYQGDGWPSLPPAGQGGRTATDRNPAHYGVAVVDIGGDLKQAYRVKNRFLWDPVMAQHHSQWCRLAHTRRA